MQIENVKVEHLDQAFGIDIPHPRITWNDVGCKKQTSFDILYRINQGSDHHIHRESSSMYYDFEETFKSRDKVEVKVIACEGQEKSESAYVSFEMGLLSPSDWSAKWISGNYRASKKKRYPVDLFFRSFDVNSIAKARLYISCCGLYEANINGKRVGDFVLAPGTTDPRKRIQYQTYDVTSLLKAGENRMEILLADGWYRGSIGAKGFTCVFGKATKVIAQLEIEDKEGKIQRIITDSSWGWSDKTPIRFADLKNGEIVDFHFTPEETRKAKEVDFQANLVASNNVPVKEQEHYVPLEEKTLPNGKILLKFPKNIAGYLAFNVKAKEGDMIDIVLGEMLNQQGELTLSNIQCVRKKKKTPLQEIHVICKEGMNCYHPKFFYAGFQYAEITTEIPLSAFSFEAIALSSDLNETSFFSCSNELINIFYRNTLNSLRSNSIDIPTDCPTRERMGWTGDAQLFFNSASFLLDYYAFSRKYVKDIGDRQSKKGAYPQIAPYSAEDWFMNVMNGSVGWADAGIYIPYRMYERYNDERILASCFDSMMRYAKFMISRFGNARGPYRVYADRIHLSKQNRKYLVNNGQSYGEWAEPNDVKAFVWYDFAKPHPEESMAYTYYSLSLLQKIAKILHREKETPFLSEYIDGVKSAYQELVTLPKYSLDTNRQCKLVRPLYFNLLTADQNAYAKNRLIQALDSYHWKLGTGFLSTPFILDVLSSYDIESAYRLLENEECPGWLYMAKHNTGTIWEGWEGPESQKGICSLNHYSKGALVEWLFGGMCGIKVMNDRRIEIKPVIGGKETFAKATYHSIYGEIKSSWEKKEGKIIIDFTVPGNTLCTFVFRDRKELLSCGSYHYEFGVI